MKHEVYRTGQAAKICGISQQSIIRCCDDGTLKSFRIPGSKHRRIPHHELIKFMVSYQIPIPDELK